MFFISKIHLKYWGLVNYVSTRKPMAPFLQFCQIGIGMGSREVHALRVLFSGGATGLDIFDLIVKIYEIF